MNGSTQKIQSLTIFFIFIFFIQACTSLSHRISEESKEIRSPSEAKSIISNLKNQNKTLRTIKGVGKITFLESEKKEMISRVAWVASAPDKIRIALSSVSGHPVVSAASNGRWFYLISHASGDFYKKRPTDANMKRFFSISIKLEDMVSMLLGRIPMIEYDSAVLMQKRLIKARSEKVIEGANNLSLRNDVKGKKYSCLLLKNKWGNIREKIYLNNKADVYKIEMFDFYGKLVYRVEVVEIQKVDSYRVPYRIRASNGHGEGFQLDTDRCWANTSISRSIFTLAPSK
jgi:hypothetical protein